MGQAVAWCSQRLDVPCSVVVPDHAPAIKLSGIERLGARTVKVPFAAFAEILGTHHMDGMTGRFLHPFADRNVMAGNGTIGLEILEDLPAVDAVIVPYGGGGLLCGIAAAIQSVAPHVRVYACEIETAAPFAASLAAGRTVEVQRRTSFVDGIGAPRVFGEMFSLAQRLATGSQVVSLEAVARAIRLLAERNHIVAEGAGAASMAAALTGRISGPRIACIVSGGNLDLDVFRGILAGDPQEAPQAAGDVASASVPFRRRRPASGTRPR
jgi:threonine dehydratase